MKGDMTREQILQMQAGEEMDRLVAEKIMGIEPPEVIPDAGWLGGGYVVNGGCREAIEIFYARYSTDIAAAWLVVEKMSKDGFVFELINVSSDCEGVMYGSSTLMHWTAFFEAEEKNGVVDATAPLAISRAALLATL